MPTDLEERLARFDERMASDPDVGRDARSLREVLADSLDVVNERLGTEKVRLGGRFHMAAQEQACRETVRDLDHLAQDLAMYMAEPIWNEDGTLKV